MPRTSPSRRSTRWRPWGAPSEPCPYAGANGAADPTVTQWFHVVAVREVVHRHERRGPPGESNLAARVPERVPIVGRNRRKIEIAVDARSDEHAAERKAEPTARVRRLQRTRMCWPPIELPSWREDRAAADAANHLGIEEGITAAYPEATVDDPRASQLDAGCTRLADVFVL